MLMVTKRDGRKEQFDINKIRKAIDYACEGLNVNSLELESKITSRFANNISTENIQKDLVLVATTLASVTAPEWIVVAGRLEIYDVARKVAKRTKMDYETDFAKVIQYMTKNGYYDQSIYKFYDDNDFSSLTKYILPNNDRDITIGGAMSLVSKYLIKNQKGVIELPQHADMAIALYLNRLENKDTRMKEIVEDYKMISNKYLSVATPFKANLRKKSGNLSSCFILTLEDSLDGITKMQDDISQISTFGGGVGIYITPLRCSNSLVGNVEAGNNITLWVKIIDAIAVAVNQKGVRKAGITVALDVWYKDLHDFINIKTEVGDLRNKSFNLFPQVVINDIFIQRVKEDGDWYLLDHYEIKRKLGFDIINPNTFKEKFNEIEEAVKSGKIKNLHIVKAKKVWVEMLTAYIETGDLYIVHKDNMNKMNPMFDANEFIQSANLCVETYSPIKASTNFKKNILNEDGKVVSTFEPGRTHVCNLISINMTKILNNDKVLENTCRRAVRMLDKAIDVTKVPIIEGELHNQDYRTIGVSAMGVADWMAYNKYSYHKEEDWLKIEELFEKIAYYTLDESCNIAQEKGSFKRFEDSYFTKGIILGRTSDELMRDSKAGLDWKALSEKVKLGVRNMLIVCNPPNTSTSALLGSSPSYLPVFNKYYNESMASMNVPFAPKFIKERFWNYQEGWTIPTEKIIKLTTQIQKWVDTGLSMELIINPDITDIKKISDALLESFGNGLKAVYYSRTIQKNNSDENKEVGCVSCAN